MGSNYYVSALNGSDDNNGLSPKTAFRSIQTAANLTQPGDTVYVMEGTYTHPDPHQNIVTITRSGTPNAWITYKAYAGSRPKLKSHNWHGISIQGAAYIVIDGFEVEGNAQNISLSEAIAQQEDLSNPTTSGNGIGVGTSLDGSRFSHHITICNNTVHHCSGGGIYTIHADYVTIENNVVHDNGFYSPWACSGISTLQNWNSDDSTGIKMVIRNNITYNNRNYIPFWMVGSITDGNGIIVDDSNNTLLGSRLAPYRGRTLIENNLAYHNGGRGVAIYRSQHVDLVNNQTFGNSLSVEIPDQDVSASQSDDVQFYKTGTHAADRIFGSDLRDVIDGKQRQDFLFGGAGDDSLLGGNGRDILVGGSGNDWLIGGIGRDRLTGGIGQDIFVLGLDNKPDWITDFEKGDRLQLPQNITFKDLRFSDVRGDLILSIGTKAIAFLQGMDTLSASDCMIGDFLTSNVS